MENQTINLGNIKLFAAKKKLPLTDLADKIGMTYVGLSKIIRENTTTLTTACRIADALGVPVVLFFTPEERLKDMEDFTFESYVSVRRENEALKREIGELKDKIIRLADRL